MTEEEALVHLGNVLYFVVDLHPDDYNDALDNALAFYNGIVPTRKVMRSDTGYQRLVDEAELARLRDEVELWQSSRER